MHYMYESYSGAERKLYMLQLSVSNFHDILLFVCIIYRTSALHARVSQINTAHLCHINASQNVVC